MPSQLLEALHAFRRRVKLLSVLAGSGRAVALGIACLLGVVLLDYLLNLHPVARLILMFIGISWIGLVLWQWVILPAMAKLSLTDIAGRLENAFPQFDDRLRSTVNFATAEVPGADVMKQRVVEQAASLAQQIDLGSAIATKPVRDSAMLATAAVALLALMVWMTPQLSKIAASRLFAPFENTPWPKSVQIGLVDHLPARVAVGQQVPISVRLERGDKPSRKAIIRFQYLTAGLDGKLVPDGPAQQQYMTRGDDGVYTTTLDARLAAAATTGQLRVEVEAGDDVRTLQAISIVPRLAVTSVTASIQPPAYAKLPPISANLLEGPATLVAGSKVALTAGFNKPLAADKSLHINAIGQQPESAPQIQWAGTSETSRTGTFVPTSAMRFHIVATDAAGLINSGLEEYELIVRPDQAPVVQIEEPRRSEERTADATVPMRAVAEDDFEIESATLIVERLGDKKRWEIELIDAAQPTDGARRDRIESSSDRQRFRIDYDWKLAALEGANLQAGDVLEYAIAVTDNYNLDGQTHPPVTSGRLRLTIISQEDFAARVAEEIRTIGAHVRDIRNNQTRTAMETTDLAKETANKDELDEGDKAAMERLANQQSTAAAQTKQATNKLRELLKRMEENQSSAEELRAVAQESSDILNHTAESPMRDAAADLNAAKSRTPQDKESRNEDLEKAGEKQASANDGLQRAIDKLGNVGTLTEAIEGFKNILDQQNRMTKELAELAKRNVGKRPEEMSKEDREQLEKLTREQEQVAKRTDSAVEQAQRDASKMERSDPASSEAMKQAAKTASQQNVSGNQRQASKSAAQNQQAQAAASQKKAELGLEMIINRLREAETRKLEELAKQLADLQEQLATLIRRQAGHNLDNLSAQGPEKLESTDTGVLSDLFEKSNRDQTAPPPAPEVGQLATAQQQTERNTRDIVKMAEAAPDGTAVGGHLTKAAGRMERSIVHLRGNKLAEAYEPPQVEALAALVQARRIIDEQKQKADEKLAEKQSESVRARYVKIRDDQAKLNTETVALDAAPRLEDGQRRRQDLVRIGQLPAEQGRLAEETKKIEEDLASVGGLVYVWANKDIVTAMNDIKAGLGKPETGAPVQTEQTRIIEQLDSMIRNLAIKPLERKFESPGGGGGGGGQCQPGVPTEAELRLLKELQLAVNKQTKQLDAAQPRDVAGLDSLGGRQRELRDLLDELLQKASQGQQRLGPEPDARDQLPEEVGEGDVEDQELDQDLLTGKPEVADEQKQANRVGDRMARSRQRLAMNHDPGQTTQIIQGRILKDLDDLIEQARKSEAVPKPNPNQQPKPGQQGQPKPQPGMANSDPKQGQPREGKPAQQPGQSSGGTTAGAAGTALPKELKETMAEWGKTSPRLRQAIVDMEGEAVIEKYKNLVDDYYRSLAERTTER